jgi:hypothetical protein
VPAGADAGTGVKAPKPGTWSGRPGKMVMSISGRSIDLLAFSFPCGATSGRTSLNSVALKKTRSGYTFAIKAKGIVTYADDRPDENGTITISGRFSRTGKSAGGTRKVKTPRCGQTKTEDWRARR